MKVVSPYFKSVFQCVLFAIFFANLSAALAAEQKSLPIKPNIIFVLTDDMRYDDLQYMPKLQARLAKNGKLFKQYIVTNSLCCPSRTSILTGQYVHNHGIWANSPPMGGFVRFQELGLERKVFVNQLSELGYSTAFLGKYLNDYPTGAPQGYIPLGWSYWLAGLNREPYTGFNYWLTDNTQVVLYGKRTDDFLPDVLAEKTVGFIKKQAEEKKPFFVYLSYYTPHFPSVVAARHKQYPVKAELSTQTLTRSQLQKKPRYVRTRLHAAKADSKNQVMFVKRIRSLQSIDDGLERIFKRLNASGIINQTYVFFTSDNGFHLGEFNLASGKETPYEFDIHVPLVVWGPTLERRSSSNALAVETDLAPTFLELAGANIPSSIDGRSLLPFLVTDQTPTDWRSCALVEHKTTTDLVADSLQSEEPIKQPKALVPSYYAFRSRESVYVEYATNEYEYYDLSKDPDQLNNLYSKLSNTDKQTLSGALAGLKTCQGQSCKEAEDNKLCY